MQVSKPQVTVSLENVTLGYGGLPVVDDYTLTVMSGQIHALAGENGAGKTTVLKAIAGLITLISGTIDIPLDQTGHAERVSFVLQHDVLPSNMTVGSCVKCASLAANGPSNNAIVLQHLTHVGLLVSPTERVANLTMHQRQLLQLACALASKPVLLLLDEPTAVMSHADTDHFWNLVQTEVQNGLTVVIATHKLEDITAYCSHVTVMRAGRLVLTRPIEDVSLEDIITGMAPASNSDTTLQSTAVKQIGDTPLVHIDGNGAPLNIHEHEVHGLAGLDGSGYGTWLEALALQRQEPLTVMVNNVNIDSLSISERRRLGIGYIPSDRHKDAFIGSESLEVNMSFGQLPSTKARLWMPIRHAQITAETNAVVDAYDVRPPDGSRLVRTLSGGNQQKFLVGRELERKNHVMVINQPTRGLDRAASSAISRKIQAASIEEKTAILVYSDDLTFLINTCDTISVVSNGRLVESRPVSSWTEASLVEAIV